jgi:hypothetical protein
VDLVLLGGFDYPVHPSTEGYERIAKAIDPKVAELM